MDIGFYASMRGLYAMWKYNLKIYAHVYMFAWTDSNFNLKVKDIDFYAYMHRFLCTRKLCHESVVSAFQIWKENNNGSTFVI